MGKYQVPLALTSNFIEMVLSDSHRAQFGYTQFGRFALRVKITNHIKHGDNYGKITKHITHSCR